MCEGKNKTKLMTRKATEGLRIFEYKSTPQTKKEVNINSRTVTNSNGKDLCQFLRERKSIQRELLMI